MSLAWDLAASVREGIVDLVSSKKFLGTVATAVTGVLVTVAGRAGWAWLDPATADALATKLVAAGAAYVLGQAAADHGKEAAQIHADGAVETARINAGASGVTVATSLVPGPTTTR